jgi:oligopeptide transport system substrate-binding protein
MIVLGTALFLAACDSPASEPAGLAVLNRGNGGEPNSLDPQRIQTLAEINIANDLFTGLIAIGADGKPVPGMAEHWEVSGDGLTWTFHLRASTWSDGAPLTAADFVWSWQHMLDPATAAEYASILYDFKNARAINDGAMPPESLGVEAPDAHTLVLHLEHPAPYLPELLSHSASFPVPRHIIEAKGAGWTRPGNFVGNGAFVLAEWVANDHIMLRKNPRFFDARHVALDEVRYYPTADYDAAIRRLRAGELDLQAAYSAQQIEWLRDNMPEALRQVPSLATYYLAVNQTRKPFDDKRIREAIALAIDREAIVNDIRRAGEPPAYSIVPPGIANYPGGVAFDFRDMPMDKRIEKARALMREAGYGPDRRLAVSYVTTSSTDNRRLSPVLQAMLGEAYFDVEIVQAEPRVAFDRLHHFDYDLAYAIWSADYDDAYNFLGLLLTSGSTLNYQGYRNAEFDRLMAAAQRQTDMAKRGALMAQAEAVALADYAMIPYRFSVTPDLVQPYVKGWIPNPKDLNPSRWLRLARH